MVYDYIFPFPQIHQVIADLTKDDDIRRIVRETVSKFGQIDIVVNNAGFLQVVPLDAPNYIEAMDHINAVDIRPGMLDIKSVF